MEAEFLQLPKSPKETKFVAMIMRQERQKLVKPASIQDILVTRPVVNVTADGCFDYQVDFDEVVSDKTCSWQECVSFDESYSQQSY